MAESQNIEWKESWKDEYLKWICGFANAQGGKIYIGTDDNGKIVGVSNSKSLLEDIPNKVQSVLGIIVDVNLLSYDGMDYIEILVNPSSYPVSYKGEYHYRSGSTKQMLRGAALNEFLLSKTGYKWEDVPVDDITAADLDKESFDIFRREALLSKRMSEEDLNISNEELLNKLDLVIGEKLKRAAVLLFYREAHRRFTGAFVKVGYFETDSDLRYQDEIEGSLFIQVDRIIDMIYLKYLKADITYDNLTRIETYPFPKDGIREAVRNALIHKDYSSGIPIQISIYKDKMYIGNSCVFPVGWTVETLFEKHNSKAHNPTIARAFFRAGLVETWGRGIEKICDECLKYGIPMPKYTVYPEDILVRFQGRVKEGSENEGIQPIIEVNVLAGLDEVEEIIIKYMYNAGSITSSKASIIIGRSVQTARKWLSSLEKKGVIESHGSGPRDPKRYYTIKSNDE